MEPIAITVTITTAIEGEDTVTASYDGLLRVKGEELRLSYTEQGEGGATSTLLTLGTARITLLRRGAVRFSTVCCEGEEHASLYSLGGLSFDAVTHTHSLRILRGAAFPAFHCEYDLTLGGERRRFLLSLHTAKREVTA